MRTRLLGLLVTAMLIAMVGQIACAKSQTVPFAPGQVWSVRSPSPTPVKVIIGRIERSENYAGIHVSIIDVPIPKGMLLGPGGSTTIGHMPFNEATLAESVDQLLQTGASPASSFEDGYRQWRDAKGGFFTISVIEAIDLAFDTIRSNPR